MARTVSTGWRTVTPGPCGNCGFDDGYVSEGDGAIYCDCQACPECHQFGGWHYPGCGEALAEEEACPECGQVGTHDFECGAITDEEADAIARECGVDPEDGRP